MDPRYCARIGCGDPVATIMQIVPRTCEVRLIDPVEPIDNEGIALCQRHADRLTVPFGWQLADLRTPPPSTLPRKRRRRTQRAATDEIDLRGDTPSSETTAPETTAPEVSPAEVSSPEVVAPAVVAPEMTAPVLSADDADPPADAPDADSTAAMTPRQRKRARRSRRARLAEAADAAEGIDAAEAVEPEADTTASDGPGEHAGDGRLLKDKDEGLDRGTDDEPTLWAELPPRMKELDTDDSTPLINRAFRWAHSIE